MILKSLTRKSGTGQLLNYLFKKEEKLIAGNQPPLIIRRNVRSKSIDKWIKEFDANEQYRIHKRKDSVKAYHTILSFSNKDKEKINEKTLRAVAKQYMKLRDNDNLFIGTAHYDKNHVHLHLVMSGTKYLTGESNRISRAEFHQLKVEMDKWQERKFPELVNSLPHHGKSKEQNKSPKEQVFDRRNGRVSQKETLIKSLESVYKKSKSIDSFLSDLRSKGYEPYYRSGNLTGVKSENGLKFRLNRLGYDKEKIALLDEFRLNEEKELSEIRNIRERVSEQREQDDDKSTRSFERDSEDESKEENNNNDDTDRYDQDDDLNFEDIDDIR